MVRTDLDISIQNNKNDSESSSDENHREAHKSALGSSYELRPTQNAEGDLESQEYDPWANFTDGLNQPLCPRKAREPQNDSAGVSRPLLNTNGAGWDTDNASPPAFLESQQGSSSMLISAGPPLRRNEKFSQHGGMTVIRPPVTE
jgi:hypothetical protein